MGKRRRGRERLLNCESCGRTMPRDKALQYSKRSFFSTDLKTSDNVSLFTERDVYYCISCGKHRGIFQKKKEQMQRQRQRGGF